MKIVAGLGNPGRDYAGTYHNVGFDALDSLAAHFCAPEFSQSGVGRKFEALVSETTAPCGDILFVKPLTYMNLSGNAIAGIARYYKVEPRDILVFYDDIDLHKGTVRARMQGSAGTHNGMRDIVAKLGSTDFARIRIGTGPKPNYMNLADYVLSHYGETERAVFTAAFDATTALAEKWLNGETWQDMTVTVC